MPCHRLRLAPSYLLQPPMVAVLEFSSRLVEITTDCCAAAASLLGAYACSFGATAEALAERQRKWIAALTLLPSSALLTFSQLGTVLPFGPLVVKGWPCAPGSSSRQITDWISVACRDSWSCEPKSIKCLSRVSCFSSFKDAHTSQI